MNIISSAPWVRTMIDVCTQIFAELSPGYKISEKLTQIIYFPIVVRSITDLTIRVVYQDNRLLDFQKEKIIVRLHV